MKSAQVISHESFGQLSVCRVSGNSGVMYGVDHPQSGHYIEITLSRSELHREHGHDHFHAKSELFRVAMTALQFSEMITTMNYGGGTPCTITRMVEDGKYKLIERPPVHMADTDTLQDEVRQHASKAAASMDEALTFARTVRNNPRASKADIDRMIELMETARREAGANLEFAVRSGLETLDERASKTKQEVVFYTKNMLEQAGITALRGGNVLGGEPPKQIEG